MQTSEYKIYCKVRPLRFGFDVRLQNNTLADVFAINTNLWGGMYNFIIPSKTPQNIPHKEYFKNYCKTFRPDFIINWNRNKKYIQDNVIQRKEILSSKDHCDSFGLSVNEVYRKLYKNEFKYQRHEKIDVIIPTSKKEKESLFIKACFGSLQSTAGVSAKDYLIKNFNAIERKIDEKNFYTFYKKKLTPLTIGSLYLTQQNINWRDHHGIFILNLEEPQDLIDFWNLRAVKGKDIIPFPIQWRKSSIHTISKIITQNYKPIPRNTHGVMITTPIYHSSNIEREKKKEVFDFLLKNNAHEFSSHGTPFIYDNGYINDMQAPVVFNRDEAVSANYQGETLKVDTLSPNFEIENKKLFSYQWANTYDLGMFTEDYKTPQTLEPSIDFKKELPSSFSHSAFKADAQEELVTYPAPRDTKLFFKDFSSTKLFQFWLESRGYKFRISGPGYTALEIIKKLGSLDEVHLIANTEIINLLNSISSGLSEEEIKKAVKIKKSSISYEQLKGKIQKINDNNPISQLNQLIEKKIFSLGFQIKCQYCENKSWYSLSELKETLICLHCLQNISATKHIIAPGASWHFKTIGPFQTYDYARGSYTVVLALNIIVNQIGGRSTWVTSMSCDELEFDFAVWKQTQFSLTKSHYKFFGECKSRGNFEQSDIEKMKKIADSFSSSILVFATLKERLNSKEINLLQGLSKHLKKSDDSSSLLILTSHELTNPNEFSLFSSNKSPRVKELLRKYSPRNDLIQLCLYTQELYIPPN